MAIFLFLAAVASADAGDTMRFRGAVPAPRIQLADGTSSNWSGYTAETNLSSPQPGSVSDVKGTWTVPAVTGPDESYSSTWVGIDGYTNGSVEQIGTAANYSDGEAEYYAWYEMYPKYASGIWSVPVKPGDTIAAEVRYAGNNQFVLSITDVTTGLSYSTTQTSSTAAMQSAEWIMEAPSTSEGVLPLADYGKASFSGASATINGHPGAINDPSWQSDTVYLEQKGIVKSTPSALSAAGSGFDLLWGDSPCAKPRLDLKVISTVWPSLPAYESGQLSVTLAVANASGQPAVKMQFTKDRNTNGVVLSTSLPLTFGDIAAGGLNGDTSRQTLVYKISGGVNQWISTFSGSAKDACGSTYNYP